MHYHPPDTDVAQSTQIVAAPGTVPMKLPRSAQLWLPGYLAARARSLTRRGAPKRLWVAITDHYEPLGGVEMPQALARVAAWQRRWPVIAAAAPPDVTGRPPQYTFFYPQEEYRAELVAPLAAFTHAGIGDVEVHLHHDHETASAFREKITTFCRCLNEEHGLLRRRDGQLIFGFIHGNWALDNSRPDGRWCGLNGEIRLLHELGCYADFTMPSLPSETQGRIVNQIYWTTGSPDRPKSFDEGIEAAPGDGRRGELLMITGPLGLRLRGRLMPRLETGELAAYDPPSPYRVARWLDLAPRIGDDIFLKLYTHGAREDNAGMLLGSDQPTASPSSSGDRGCLAKLFRWLHAASVERHLELHWATAYEMYDAIEQLVAPRLAGTDPTTTSSVGKRPVSAVGRTPSALRGAAR